MNQTGHTLEYYRQREQDIFLAIPGMKELLQNYQTSTTDISEQYPDAAFALMTANELMSGDRECNAIHQQAYFSILQGKNVADVHTQYRKAMNQYLQEHTWDD